MDGKLLHKVKIVINTSVVEKLGNGVWNYSAEVYFRGVCNLSNINMRRICGDYITMCNYNTVFRGTLRKKIWHVREPCYQPSDSKVLLKPHIVLQ